MVHGRSQRHRMKPALWSPSRFTNPLLGLIAIALCIAVLAKHDIVSLGSLARNKDALDAVASLVTTTAVVIGGSLTYLRFFHRRVFHPKLNLSLLVTRWNTARGEAHSIEVRLKNVGPVAIWNYEVKLIALHHPLDGSKSVRSQVPTGVESSNERLRDADEVLIDVGETDTLHYVHSPDGNLGAVTYTAVVRLPGGARWLRSRTVPSETRRSRTTSSS